LVSGLRRNMGGFERGGNTQSGKERAAKKKKSVKNTVKVQRVKYSEEESKGMPLDDWCGFYGGT